jgi:hypothetical protein
MIASADGSFSAEEMAAKLTRTGLSVNRVESVALAVAYLVNNGSKSNGMGVLVQSDKMVNLEQGYAKSRETLMGTEMLEILRKGLSAELYPRLKVDSKM